MHAVRSIFTPIVFSFILLFSFVAFGAPGDLDPTFGSGGKLITTGFRPDPSASSSARAVAIQPDGKIVAAGTSGELFGTQHHRYIAIARYNPDGSLDSTFGNGGRVSSDAAGLQIEIWAMALLPDGKILLGGGGFNFVLVRFNSNGSLDTAWGNNGVVTTDFAGGSTNDDSIYSIVVQPDGKIAAAGYARVGSLRDFALARYNSDGTPDTTFDTDGKLTTQFSSSDDEALALLRQPDGKLIAAGYGFGSSFDFALARYNVDGSLDMTFDGDGKVLADFFGSTDQARAAVLQPDGKIVAAGNVRQTSSTPSDMAVARFNSDGSLDTTFDSDGRAVVDFNALSDFAYALVRQSNGKLVLGGYATVSGQILHWEFAVTRLNSNGSIDTTFGTQGRTTLNFNPASQGDDFIRGMALQADGKIVAAGGGRDQPNESTRMALTRFLGDPVTQNSASFDFDGDGKTDIGIFRPVGAFSEWWINRSGTGQTLALQFGASTDKIAPADYTGDGKADIAFFRPASGEWYILRSEDFSFFALPFGASGDIPVPADYDADGKADFAAFRPSNSTWYISQSSGAPTRIEQFGATGDHPVVSDYDGDGKADIGIFRPAATGAEWWINRSTAGVLALQFGASTDKPVQGDYTGDGKTDIAIWRPASGEWLIVRSEDLSFYGFPFGASGDVIAPGDYDGDGKFDPTVFRPSSATWFIARTTAGTQIIQFGANGDKPVPNAFVP